MNLTEDWIELHKNEQKIFKSIKELYTVFAEWRHEIAWLYFRRLVWQKRSHHVPRKEYRVAADMPPIATRRRFCKSTAQKTF